MPWSYSAEPETCGWIPPRVPAPAVKARHLFLRVPSRQPHTEACAEHPWHRAATGSSESGSRGFVTAIIPHLPLVRGNPLRPGFDAVEDNVF